MFRYFDIFTLFGEKKNYTMFKIYNEDGTTEPQNVKKKKTLF